MTKMRRTIHDYRVGDRVTIHTSRAPQEAVVVKTTYNTVHTDDGRTWNAVGRGETGKSTDLRLGDPPEGRARRHSSDLELFITVEDTRARLEEIERRLAERYGLSGDVRSSADIRSIRAQLIDLDRQDRLEEDSLVADWHCELSSLKDWEEYGEIGAIRESGGCDE